MVETVYLTPKIWNTLINMGYGPKEKIAVFLADKISDEEIFVINVAGPMEGETTSVSLNRLFSVDYLMAAVINANRILQEQGLPSKYMIFSAHSHSFKIGKIIDPGSEGWSCDNIPPEFNAARGRVTSVNDMAGNLLHFSLKKQSDGKRGDDLFIEMIANKWRLIEYQFFVRPPLKNIGKLMTNEVAIDCYKYDPQMILGKIRKIPISGRLLGPKDLIRTLLDSKQQMFVTDKITGNIVLPFRR